MQTKLNNETYEELINKTLKFVQVHHQANYSGHDFEHIKRVWHNARLILTSEPSANKEIVELAVLLHDVDDYKFNDNSNHAQNWLQKLGLATKTIERIIKIIDSIGFSKTGYNPQFDDIETKIVYDADKLDAIGAIGIARAFAFGGAKSRPLFNPQHFPPEGLNLVTYANNSKSGDNHSVNHFFEKLLHLSKLMQTSLGTEMAKQRQTTMKNFLKEFFVEQNLLDWQERLDKIDN